MKPYKTSEFVEAMQRIAPLEFAEAWDNVGLLAGDPAQAVTRVLLAIDCTKEVLAEAEAMKADAIVAYHPPIFAPVKRIVAPSLLRQIVRSGIAVYSPHTALDCAIGGTNDALADLVGMKDRKPLVARKRGESVKLVTFVPTANVEAVTGALFEAGAGRIGAYRECSFRSAGTGTFYGEEGTSPAVGASGKRESVAEVRVEVVVALAGVPAAIAALRAAHPYEEPAFDLVALAAIPAASGMSGAGMGRIGAVDGDVRALVERVRSSLGLDAVLVAGPGEGSCAVVAVLAGSAGDLLSTAIDRGARVVVTGEVRHHDALSAAARGATVICTLHSNSERLALPALAKRLAADSRAST